VNTVNNQSPVIFRFNITVVIVNYATGKLLEASITKLQEEAIKYRLSLNVIIVDNNSPDDSVKIINDFIDRNQWQKWVTVLAEAENHGFAKGNNIGFKKVLDNDEYDDEQYILCLNPDAYITDGAINELLIHASSNKDVGIVGSHLINENGSPRASCFNDPSALRELQRGLQLGLMARVFKQPTVSRQASEFIEKVDWVSGASFLFNASILKITGLMDETFFLYFEEADFMRKVRACNYDIVSIPSSKVIHLAGQSTQIKGGKSTVGKIPPYWYRSWRHYFTKNNDFIYAWFAGCFWILGRMVRNTINYLKRTHNNDGHHIFDFIKYALLGK
jgi:GT2 family glycosyltransferase